MVQGIGKDSFTVPVDPQLVAFWWAAVCIRTWIRKHGLEHAKLLAGRAAADMNRGPAERAAYRTAFGG
jgi:hypothetical protein